MAATNATEPTYEVKNSNDLNKFLAGALKDIRTKKMTVEEADVISKVADKINKNNIAAILEMKRINSKEPLEFFNAEKEIAI